MPKEQKSYLQTPLAKWTALHCKNWILHALKTGDMRPGRSFLAREIGTNSDYLRDALPGMKKRGLRALVYRDGLITACRTWKSEKNGYDCLAELATCAWELAEREPFDWLLRHSVTLTRKLQTNISREERNAIDRVLGYTLWRCASFAFSREHWQPKFIHAAQMFPHNPRFSLLLKELTVDLTLSINCEQLV